MRFHPYDRGLVSAGKIYLTKFSVKIFKEL